MAESLAMVGMVWFFHAVVAGWPAIVAYVRGVRGRWVYGLALVVVPFGALLPAQVIWPVGGASSFLTRLVVLTCVVFVAQVLEAQPSMRRAPAWSHPLILAAAVLSVIPIQLLVPSYPD